MLYYTTKQTAIILNSYLQRGLNSKLLYFILGNKFYQGMELNDL